VCLFRRPAAIVIGHSARILVVLVGLILLVWAMAGDEDRAWLTTPVTGVRRERWAHRR
jgi:hypothetical protein